MNLPHKLYKSMGLTPLKFTFNLATPFVKSGYPIHLDSLVGFIFQRHHLPLEDAPNEAAIMAFLADLPFEKYEQDEDWVFLRVVNQKWKRRRLRFGGTSSMASLSPAKRWHRTP